MIRTIWKFLSSVKLTIVLFVLILVPSVVGTLIQQNAPDPLQYKDIYGAGWDKVFRFLGFYDIYHDPRFIILLVLLGLNTLACTIKRFKLRWALAGMMLTHFGLLFILLGAVTGAILGMKGFVAIREGETTNTIQIGDAVNDTAVLPFELKLVDFILDTDEEPIQRLMALNMQSHQQESHQVEGGEDVALFQSRWTGLFSLIGIRPKLSKTIRIDEIIPHAALVTSFTEGPAATGTRAIDFRLVGDEVNERGFAISQPAQPYISRATELGVYYTAITNRDQIEHEIESVESLSGQTGHLEVSVPGSVSTTRYPVEIGTRFAIADTGYSVKVLRYVPDFVMNARGEVASRTAFPNNPAVQVQISGATGSQVKWLFAKFPFMFEAGEQPFELGFHPEGHSHGTDDYLLALSLADNESEPELTLAHIRKGQLIERHTIEQGATVPIMGTDYAFVVDGLYENANKIQEVVNHPDTSNTAAMKIVVEEGGAASSWYLWEDRPVDIPGYKLMYAREDRIRDFYSILQVIDGGHVVAEKTIEVNDPLRYKGYSFYQSSYDREALSWSGLQVKKDPGVPLVYGGFLIQIAGMIIIFYVNPLLRKMRRAETSRARESRSAAVELGKAKGA